MIWLLSILVGFLTAAPAAFVAGFIAAKCVAWYHLSRREGADGYFVIAIGLLGLIAGFVIGVTCGFSLGADLAGGFFKSIALAIGIVVALGAIALAICHALADIPPTIGGRQLFLIVEARLPADRTTAPAVDPFEAYLRFGSLSGHTLRKSERGQLWNERATLVDGRWIVPGAVQIFTSRGKRVLEIHAGSDASSSFLVPLPAHPRKAQLVWSDWLPRRFPLGVAPEAQMTYRFRVERDSEPMFTEAHGCFQITSYVRRFQEGWDRGRSYVTRDDAFTIGYRGAPVSFEGSMGPCPVRTLITLPGNPAALLANVLRDDGSCNLHLVQETGTEISTQIIVPDAASVLLEELSATEEKTTLFCPSENHWLLARNGLYRIGLNTIFDTRTLATHSISKIANLELGDLHSLGLSPDERSFVRFTFEANTQAPMLTVTDFVADRSYSLPINRTRMRYVKIQQITPAWAAHHFKWDRDAAGIDQLVARTDFQLLPFRGELHRESDTRSAWYLYGATEGIADVLESVLIDKFAAQLQPPAQNEVDHTFLVGTAKVKLFASSDIVSVTTDDHKLAEQIAAALNAELATYKHDALFVIK
jgi:hypothetical protein